MKARFLMPFFGLLTLTALRGGVAITDLQPTVLFPNKETVSQLAWLSVLNSGTAVVDCEAIVKVDGKAGSPQPLQIAAGPSTQDVLIPDLAKPVQVEIELRGKNGEALAQRAQPWQPQRKWIVYLIKSSHEDIGYEDFIYEKQRQIADNIDLANKLSAAKENSPDTPGKASPRDFHYTLETLLFQRNYIDERSEAAWRKIVEESIKPGKMELFGAPSGDHTQWMDYEELARSNYPGRRESKDRFGLDLKTYLMVDNPSMSWSAAQAAANAGFRYVMRLGQPWRTGGHNDYKSTKLPAIFWWEGPDGSSRVLYSWSPFYGGSFWYGEPDGGGANLADVAKSGVDRRLKAIQSGEEIGPYPYDAVIIPAYEDHETPKWDNRAIRHWQSAFRYPEIRIAGITDYFEYMERKYGKDLPTERGELNNFSGDYATIDPAGQGWKRQASRLLPVAEGTAALASLLDPAYQPQASVIERTFQRLFDFTEHSWPTSPPPVDRHLFNAQWVKHLEARRALDSARALADDGMAALFQHISTEAAPSIAVFNALAHPRTDLVKIEGDYPNLVDSETGRPVLTQKIGDKTIFVAENMPAYGYKVFHVAASGAADAKPALEVKANSISNEFYTIRFDQSSGAITSILDRQLNHELVDPAAKFKFNQMVWVHKNSRDGKQGENHPVNSGAKLTAAAGAVQAEMLAQIDDPLTGAALSQKVILYRGLKRIDIVDSLAHAKALNAEDRKERYRENIYYAFPVDVMDFTARVEYPGGVIRPFDDQLRWGSHDFLNANWWTDVSNAKYGVTMAPWNATTLNFGDIRYNQFSNDYKPENSHLFSYAWSNRMSGLLELTADEWNVTLGYSFTSHEGDWNSGAATQFGWSIATPLEARVLAAGQKGSLPAKGKSFLSVEAPNVQLTTLKQSIQPGRGWVARLVETEGKAGNVTLDLSHFPLQGAAFCDLVENDLNPLPVKNGKVAIAMKPFSFATIRFYGADPSFAGVQDFKAEALSDKSIKLSWAAIPGAAAYLVYRSEDPQAPPTAYTLVGRAVAPSFTDDWLKIATDYFYHVAPISALNLQGPISNALVARTDGKNVSPPHPVEGLGIVRDGADQLTVFWQKSPEPDTARYYVYRSEQPGVDPAKATLVATLPATRLFLQTFPDKGLKPTTTYYYKVLAEDWAGNRQAASPETSSTTPAANPANLTPVKGT